MTPLAGRFLVALSDGRLEGGIRELRVFFALLPYCDFTCLTLAAHQNTEDGKWTGEGLVEDN